MVEPHDELAIEAIGLVKDFGSTLAVNGVDLAVRRGTVYGVLGPNGAGKTTTIRMLATLLHPTAGSARVLGHDIVTQADAVRSRVSLTGQLASVDDEITGRENLVLLGRLLGFPQGTARARAQELLEAFGLAESADRVVREYSGGMRRRLDIAASIVVTPELLFLDEPTTGLDPRSRNQVWDIVRALVAGGTTVLLCTQYLEEADQLADRIAIIDHGRVIAEGTPGQLKASVGAGSFRVRLREPHERAEAHQLLSVVLAAPVLLESDPAVLSTHAPETDDVTRALDELARAGIAVGEFSYGQRVAVDDDGMVYVSNGSQLAGAGTVIRVDPTVARDPATAAACDPVEVPGAGFTDVGANVHREAIDCLAWWEIVNGRTATTFAPQSNVRRDQVASIVARLLEAAGVEMPASPPNAFTDDEGNTHEDSINALAELDVLLGRTATTFAPSSPVTRGQVASILARAYEVVTGEALPGGPDAFDDDDGTTHEASINAVAEAGWVNGTGPATFRPSGNATRAQLTSMVARMLSTLVDEGHATAPA